MKVARSVAGILALFVVLFSLQINVSSCQKEIIKDTVRIKDTIRIRDTVRIVDSSTCSCYDLSDGLVAYYNFTGGTLNDSSGYNNNITFNNATKTADRFGRPNNAYLFNGTSSYMKVANSASLNPAGAITLMGIVKLNGFYGGTCHGNQIFQKGTKDQNQGVYSLRVGDVTSDCYATVDTTKERATGFYGDFGSTAGASDITKYAHTNIWMTLVMTYDGHESKFYVDGQLKSTVAGSAVFTPNSFDLFIGRAESPEYPYWWNGIIDEMRIYNKALCEGAVKQLSSLKN
ncbi:MAG: LamG domain-containing protein [Bacteroidota bacterium]